jgi:hypothetical protein
LYVSHLTISFPSTPLALAVYLQLTPCHLSLPFKFEPD